MSTDPAGVVLRPSARAYRAWLRRGIATIVPACLLLAGAVWVTITHGVDPLTLTVGVLCAAALGGIVALITTSRVVLTPGAVEHRRWLVVRTTLPTDDVRGILTRFVLPGSALDADLLVLQHRDGGRRIRLNGAFWDHDDLAAIAWHAGVRESDQVMRIADVEAELPHILMWRERHWVVGSTLMLTALVAGLAAVVLVLLAVARAGPFA